MEDKPEVAIWSLWLDGDSVSRIVEWGPLQSRAKVKAILAGEPPAEILDDPRYVHGGRFFWISAAGLQGAEGSQAFVVVRTPRVLKAELWTKGIRAVRRAVRDLGGDLNLNVVEGAGGVDAKESRETTEAYLRMVTKRGYRCFSIDDDGRVEVYEPAAIRASADTLSP